MAPTTPAKVDGKPIASDKDAEFLILVMQSLKTEPVVSFPPCHFTFISYARKTFTDTRELKAHNCHNPSVQIDFDKLAQLSGMASKASANTKWYKLRHKYMPGGVSPKKRKDDGGNDSSAGSGEAKAAKKPRTPRKTNKSPKKEDPKDEEELDEDDETAIKADPFRVKSEED